LGRVLSRAALAAAGDTQTLEVKRLPDVR